MTTKPLFPFLVPFLLGAAQVTPLHVDTDVAQFRYDDEANYLELYYAIDEGQLTYVEKEGRFEGALLMLATFISPTDESVVLDRVWRIPHAVEDTSGELYRNSVMGVIGLAIPNGDYTLKMECFDENNNSRRFEVIHPVPEKSFAGDSIKLSEIELCSSRPKPSSDIESVFYKNTLEVLPNPGNVYGPGAPFIHYYMEAYNLLTSSKEGVYHTVASVSDSEGRVLMARRKTKSRVNESSVETGSINISSLPSGTYHLNFSVTDSVADVTVASVKTFHMVGEYPPRLSAGVLASEYGGMQEEDLDREFEMMEYIVSDEEAFRYESFSSSEEKRMFLFDFWRRRDPNLQTAVNEYKREFFSRVDYTNQAFRVGRKEGWKTDRGRVYLTYGPPDEYERSDSEMGMKPYEIWYYHEIQGGVMFVFADLFGFRDHLLLHSTHRNELRDDNWEIQVRE
ncbi:MAG: GWxTD domain-containing protein [Candidatus Neomarinimicrobiota bacterium]